MSWLPIMGGLGGLVAAVGAVILVGRGVFRQVSATEDNTAALRDLTGKVGKLDEHIQDHETRLAVLEDRRRRGRA